MMNKDTSNNDDIQNKIATIQNITTVSINLIFFYSKRKKNNLQQMSKMKNVTLILIKILTNYICLSSAQKL